MNLNLNLGMGINGASAATNNSNSASGGNVGRGSHAAALQHLHDSLTNSEFGQAGSIPLSPDVSAAAALDASQHLLVDTSDQYLKPIARSTTPS
ncbi:hypothetical protein LPJ57_002150, partial [Coemansia sp. RSA 486]